MMEVDVWELRKHLAILLRLPLMKYTDFGTTNGETKRAEKLNVSEIRGGWIAIPGGEDGQLPHLLFVLPLGYTLWCVLFGPQHRRLQSERSSARGANV